MPQHNHARVLIVEDNPGTAALQKRAVERAGYLAVAAASVEEGLAVLRGSAVHLILLDNRLPGGMSGLDFLGTLRSIAPDIPVIMVSGSEHEGAVIQALRSGVRDFIRKDIDYLNYLPQAIETVLQRTRLEAQLRGERPAGRRAVLLLEGSETAAALEQGLLERSGFQVLTTADGDHALRLIAENDVALLVLDRDAADGSGVDVLRRIRTSSHNIPAILMMASRDEAAVIQAVRAGFEDVVLREGDYLPVLLEAVQRALERARMAAQVAESNARLAGIVSSATDPMILLDEQMRITMFNPAAEHVFETPAANAVGDVITRFIPGIGEYLPHAGEQSALRWETKGKGAGGQECELEVSTASVEAGTRRFISVIARNVTERNELERRLLQKDKLESLGLLAGGIAHDFNNLLVGIMGNASLALETLSTNNPARSMLKDVMLASETAGNLTRQLLAYAGKGRFVVEPIDISDLVRQISSLVQTSIPKNVQLRLELAPDLPSVEADVTQMQQLLMNLVINAAEAIGEKDGTVLITTGTQHVDDDYISTVLVPAQIGAGMYVSLQVHDTGSGMSQETVDRIFDPFFTTKFTGRGLGLAAVLGIVRGHRGAIKVYSTQGQGTTFKVLLPASEQHVARQLPPTTVERAAGGETVLVVDDEQIVRRSAKAMLERYGFGVVLAENGKEAVELYKVLGDKIHVVLLDMTMPVMGGEETFQQLKLLQPDVAVVLSSGYNEVEAIRRFAGKGLAGFIQKPYSALSLVEKIRAVLNEARGTAQS